jgi:hypothetical protein
MPVVAESTGESQNESGKKHAFALGIGDNGMTISGGNLIVQVVTLMFKAYTIGGFKVNSLYSQPTIGLPIVVPVDNGAGDEDWEITELPFWDKVYLYWEVDKDSCAVMSCCLKKESELPDPVLMDTLDEDLKRPVRSIAPVDPVNRKYWVEIGSVNQTTGTIIQKISTDFTWAVPFVHEGVTAIDIPLSSIVTTVIEDNDTNRGQIKVDSGHLGAHDYQVRGNGKKADLTINSGSPILSWQDGLVTTGPDNVNIVIPTAYTPPTPSGINGSLKLVSCSGQTLVDMSWVNGMIVAGGSASSDVLVYIPNCSSVSSDWTTSASISPYVSSSA